MTLFALGLNHTTAPVEIREKVAFTGETLPGVLSTLRREEGIEEVAILSTCNRTEIYCSLDDPEQSNALPEWLSRVHHLQPQEIRPFLYSYPDAGAVKHLLRVASGLGTRL